PCRRATELAASSGFSARRRVQHAACRRLPDAGGTGEAQRQAGERARRQIAEEMRLQPVAVGTGSFRRDDLAGDAGGETPHDRGIAATAAADDPPPWRRRKEPYGGGDGIRGQGGKRRGSVLQRQPLK